MGRSVVRRISRKTPWQHAWLFFIRTYQTLEKKMRLESFRLRGTIQFDLALPHYCSITRSSGPKIPKQPERLHPVFITSEDCRMASHESS